MLADLKQCLGLNESVDCTCDSPRPWVSSYCLVYFISMAGKACQHPHWLHPPSLWWCVFVFPVWSGGANVQSLSHVQLLATHELQHTRFPCPSLFPRVCLSSCPVSQWSHPIISSSVTPFSSCSQIFPSITVFSNKSALHIRWPKYWSFSFSISPSNEYSGLISFRIDWFDLLTVQGTLKSLLQNWFESINFSALSLLYGPTLTSTHDS